jgi:hypothetical protein
MIENIFLKYEFRILAFTVLSMHMRVYIYFALSIVLYSENQVCNTARFFRREKREHAN